MELVENNNKVFPKIWYAICLSRWATFFSNLKFLNKLRKRILSELTFRRKKPELFLLCKHSVIKKDGLNFVRLHFLNYTWYVNDLHNI